MAKDEIKQLIYQVRRHDSKPPTDKDEIIKDLQLELGLMEVARDGLRHLLDSCEAALSKSYATNPAKPTDKGVAELVEQAHKDAENSSLLFKGVSSERDAMVLKMREVACDESECGDSYFEQFIDLCAKHFDQNGRNDLPEISVTDLLESIEKKQSVLLGALKEIQRLAENTGELSLIHSEEEAHEVDRALSNILMIAEKALPAPPVESEACNHDPKLIHECAACNNPCNCEDNPCSCQCNEDEM